MLNALNGHGRKYSFDRDVLGLFPDIVANAGLHAGNRDGWMPVLKDFAAQTGMTDADLQLVFARFTRFMELATRPESGERLAHTWVAAGLDAVPRAALLAFVFQVGCATVGAWHRHVRANVPAHGRAPMFDDVAGVIDRAAFAAAAPTAGKAAARQADAAAAAADTVARNHDELKG